MEKTLQRLASFATFDLPLSVGYNQLLLRTIHKEQVSVNRSWNIEGTRRRLIAHYWYRHVLYHFLSLFYISLLIILPFGPYLNLLIYTIYDGNHKFLDNLLFYLFTFFSSAFLPQLETLIANYKKAQVEIPRTKSAKTQTKIPALTIILYTLFKTAGAERISSDAFSAQMINRLTGVDTDSIKENLRRIIHPKTLTPKERAEIVKGIAVAKIYFEKLGHPPAIKLLDGMEMKLRGA